MLYEPHSLRINAKPLVLFEVIDFATFGSCKRIKNGSNFSTSRLDGRIVDCLKSPELENHKDKFSNSTMPEQVCSSSCLHISIPIPTTFPSAPLPRHTPLHKAPSSSHSSSPYRHPSSPGCNFPVPQCYRSTSPP